MTTLEDVQRLAHTCHITRSELDLDLAARDLGVRQCYSASRATLAELARATGLSKQRIHVIVREGAE